MKLAAHSFDTVGTIARSVGDIALVHAVLMNSEPNALRAIETPPRIGILRTHLFDTVDAPAAAAFETVIARLHAAGARLSDVKPPAGFERITQRRAVINAFERARNLAGEWLASKESISRLTAEVVERGLRIGGGEYAAARADVEAFRTSAGALFADVDVLLTPVTPGEAPLGLEQTGDPRLQEIWTMLHIPSITVPSGNGASGLPLGVQLVAPRFRDNTLLSTAGWVETRLAPNDPIPG
jgi:Asp-tRNA(Asn)/Glu-tRNA(Gln) amidotransferase A subunit family amidase